MITVYKILILVFFYFLSVEISIAQKSTMAFRHLTNEDGLSQCHIFAILQDRQGFMWFATQDGLNRYDGYTFVVYKHNPDNPESLSDNVIRDLVEDDNGNLWIATSTGGINKFDPTTERFTHYRHDPDNPNSISGNTVLSIALDNHGYLWFGTDFFGLNKFDQATETFTHYRNDSYGQFVGQINDIIEDSHGDIWFVGNRGLHHMNTQTGKITCPSATINRFSADYIYEDKAGSLWMLAYSPAALIKYDPKAERITEYPLDAIGLFSCNLLDDEQNGFWVPSRQGLFYFDRKTERFNQLYKFDETKPHSLNDNNVVSIYKDRAGLLWLGTENGGVNILNFQQEQFGYYQHNSANPNSLSPGKVSQIYEDSDGILWLGYFPRALDRFDRSSGQIIHYVPDPENKNTLGKGIDLNSILKDSQGYVWLGGWNSGLDRLDERSGQFKHYRHNSDDSNSLISNNIIDIYEDRSGNLWVGQSDGLSRFDRATEQFTHYLHDPNDPASLGDNSVKVIYQDRSGVLWLGTWQGVLSRFDNKMGTFLNYRPDSRDPHRLYGGAIHTIHEDRNGTLWLGASDGLYQFNRKNETFTRYTESQGLPSSSIMSILEDNAGRLWIGTRNGLSRFDPKTRTFRNYDAIDGVQDNNFTESCYWQGCSGEMFFGGSKGFYAFFPEDIRDNPYVPPIVLTDFRLFGKSVPINNDSVLRKTINQTDTLTLYHKQNNISFEFAALSYAAPEKNQYRYILEGFDADWHDVGSKERLAVYTNIRAGDYIFKVEGTNEDGIWNKKGKTILIKILTPWWQTWWFRSMIIIMFFTFLYVGFRLRIRNIKIRSLEFEHLVEERTAQLETSNKELEAFAYSVSHDLRTPLRGISGFSQILLIEHQDKLDDTAKNYLQRISTATLRMSQLIDDMLSLSRVSRAEMSIQLLDLSKLAQEIANNLMVNQPDRKVVFTIQAGIKAKGDKGFLQIVLKNLIGNAWKFTSKQSSATIEFGIFEQDDKRVFFVRDNGAGFNMKYAHKLFGPFQRLHSLKEFSGTGIGLATVQRILQRHGGKVWAEGEVGKGATFYFTIQ